jgi:hypothetical protein
VLAGLPRPGAGRRKKLEDAARLWARREFKNEAEHVHQEADAQDSLSEQCAALGVQPDAPVDLSEPLLPFYLFPENLPAWQLWQSVQSQWRGGLGHEGLDYPGVQVVIGQHRAWRLRRRQRFAEIQLMERTCLREWADQAQEERTNAEQRR